MSNEAMQQALEALEVEQIEVQLFRLVPKPHLTNAITVLREALAEQPVQQKPVGWWDDKLGFFAEKHFDQLQPIYKSPPQRTWVGLTDDELADFWFKQSLDWMEFARVIEDALRSKNT